MSKFSLARQPYYITVAVFGALCAVVGWWNNTLSTGYMSDVFLAITVGSVGVAFASLVYLGVSMSGEDDEQDIEVAGLQMGKEVYYLAVLALCGWRAVSGYDDNHNTTGLSSTWGMIWLLVSVFIAIFTWANYKSYTKKKVKS